MEEAEQVIHFNSLPSCAIDACLSALQPRELAVAAAVCRTWRQHVASLPAWQQFYKALWPARQELASGAGSWQAAFASRTLTSRCYMGRGEHDRLFGHTDAVRTAALSPGGLITGSRDRTLRLWDLEAGVCVGVTRPFGGTVRCVSADAHMLAAGGSDCLLRLWPCGSSGRPNLQTPPILLRGHTGPVTALQLTESCLMSTSWDTSLRVWGRSTLECLAVEPLGGFATCLATGGAAVAAAAGCAVQLFDIGRGGSTPLAALQLARSRSLTSHTAVTALAMANDSRRVFLGTEDGGIWAADLRGGGAGGPALQLLQHQAGGITGLSWEHPCLAASTQLGQVVLVDVEAAAPIQPQPASSRRAAPTPSHRVLSPGGLPGAALCVSTADQRLAVGYEGGVVGTWDFSKALEHQQAAAAARQSRQQRRQRNRDRVQGLPQGPRAGRSLQEPASAAVGLVLQLQARAAPAPWPAAQQAEGSMAPPGHSLAAGEPSPSSPAASPHLAPAPLGRPASAKPTARVPGPFLLGPATAGADGCCRQQAWQVLGSHQRPKEVVRREDEVA